jgi:hypothetical protein
MRHGSLLSKEFVKKRRSATAAVPSAITALTRNAIPKPNGDQAERRTAKTERYVEKDRVGAHGNAAALRWGAAYSFDAEPRIHQ